MLLVTYLAKWEVIFFGLALAVLFLFYLGHRYYSLILIFSVTCGEIFVWITKNIVERERPSAKDAAVVEKGFSFPSGHEFMAVSFFGLLAYYFFVNVKNRFLKFLIIFLASLLILAVGFSRIYLGVHWASDVLASLVAGFAWITALITFFKIKKEFGEEKYKGNGRNEGKRRKRKREAVALGIVLFSVWFAFFWFFASEQAKDTPINVRNSEMSESGEKKILVSQSELVEKIFQKFPRVSENIVGKPMEPINLVVVGKKDELEKSFLKSGWYLCDPINVQNTWKMIIATIFNQPYFEAPGIPSLWDAIPNDFAFEKPTAKMSVREREHVHFWNTPFEVEDGRNVWVGTAHFDKTIKLKSSLVLPTHVIDPAVDKERERIKEDLLNSGMVESVEEFKITEPTMGTNQSGDQFFTDGKAYLIYLR